MNVVRASSRALTLVACLVAGKLQGRPMEVEDLFRIQRISDPQPSPDGRWIAVTVTEVDKGENRTQSDIWLMPSDRSTPPRKLAASPKHDRHPRWSPDGKWIVFESNRSGDFQIHVIPVDGGEARLLVSIASEGAQPVWSPDGLYVAFVSAVFPEFSDLPFIESDRKNREKQEGREKSKVKARIIDRLLYRHWDSWVDDKRQHLFVVGVTNGVAAGVPRDLTPGDRDAVPTSSTFSAGDDFGFSPDGSELAYTATPTPAKEEAWSTNHDLWVVDVRTGKRRALTTQPAADAFPRYSPDGKRLAYRAQRRAGFEADRWELMMIDLPNGQPRSVSGKIDRSVESFAWMADGSGWVVEAEEEGRKKIFQLSSSGQWTPLVSDGVNSDVAVDRTGGIWFTQARMTRAPEVWTIPRSGTPRAFSQFNETIFAGLDLAVPESVTYEGAGGQAIQMWILKPPGFSPDRRHPLVFWVHGGPQSAFMDSWSVRWNPQVWAAQGYVIAMPNPRGSTGFGQKFTDEISGDWGGRVMDDLMRGVAWMEKQSYIDTSRMAAAGASFGGYVMNWFQGHTRKFRTLVTHCGVYNFDTMYGTTEELWFDEWDHGIPWLNPEFSKHSPHRFAANFKTPNLVIHNELDFRVPIAQGLDLFTALQRQKIPSRLLYFPDEGHWVLKPQNSELWHQTIFAWLKDYLVPKP